MVKTCNEKIFLLLLLSTFAVNVCKADDNMSDELNDEYDDDAKPEEEPEVTADYCDPDLCAKGKKHIGCKNNGDFDHNCPKNKTLLPLSEDNIELIVDLHNKYRNKIASGSDPRFKPASRMSTMVRARSLS
jgi:hypothetical protein